MTFHLDQDCQTIPWIRLEPLGKPSIKKSGFSDNTLNRRSRFSDNLLTKSRLREQSFE